MQSSFQLVSCISVYFNTLPLLQQVCNYHIVHDVALTLCKTEMLVKVFIAERTSVFSMASVISIIKLYAMWLVAAGSRSVVAQSSGADGENPDKEQEKASPRHN